VTTSSKISKGTDFPSKRFKGRTGIERRARQTGGGKKAKDVLPERGCIQEGDGGQATLEKTN